MNPKTKERTGRKENMQPGNTSKLLALPELQREIRRIFKANLDALFQTALLLTADPEAAEASLASSLDSVDLLSSPQEDKSAILQEAMVLRSIQRARNISPADTANARSMLRPGLWPILQIESRPRLCFVLRMLLGYATSSCAQMLCVEEDGVRALLQNAILQLHDIVFATAGAFTSNTGETLPSECSKQHTSS